MILSSYEQLLERYADIQKLGDVTSILMWDQNTYMPPGAVNMRGEQQALISGFAHRTLTSEKTGELISKVRSSDKLDEKKRAVLRDIERGNL